VVTEIEFQPAGGVTFADPRTAVLAESFVIVTVNDSLTPAVAVAGVTDGV